MVGRIAMEKCLEFNSDFSLRKFIAGCLSAILLVCCADSAVQAGVVTVPTASDPLANGDNFQYALKSAACGDTIVLQAGATYATRVTTVNSYGPQGYPFSLPNKSCASGQYVTIQTSQAASLPSGRIGPANIGLMATLATNSNSWVIETAEGAGNYQFIGIEFTNTSNVPANNGFNPTLVMASPQYAAYGKWSHDMVFDRVWIHPYDDVTNPSGTTRTAGIAIRLDGANQTIKNSYISGFCCFQSNAPTVVVQSEGIAIPIGPGPVTITNNFVEAFGWNIFTGGSGAVPNPANQTTISGATLTQATFASTANLLVGDYVAFRLPKAYTNGAGVSSIAYVVAVDAINGNIVTYHGVAPDAITTPLPPDGTTAAWRGVRLVGVTVTKNTFSKRTEWCSGQYGISKAVWEMKDGSNVLFEGNIVTIPPGCSPLTPAFATNQDGSAPWMATNNNTFRNNLFLGLGRLIVLQGYSYHASVPPTGTFTFTNNLFDGTPRVSFMETTVLASPTTKWVVTHNTVRGITNSIFHDISDGTRPVSNLTFRDNIVTSGGYFFNPNSSYPGKVEDHNVIINNSGSAPPSYTSGDFVVSNDGAVGFVDVSGADGGGDYHGYALAPGSPFKGRASDGTDPGVNFTTLDAALSTDAGSSGTTGTTGTSGSSSPAAPSNLIVK